ncbi:MAG: MBL fold metallo-hydrolase [archaeon]|nr:MBL fold metallo-hydrolase [archaeon]
MFQEILPNLFAVFPSDSGSNSYLLMGKKIALIDSGLGKNPADWRDFLRLSGLTLESIDFVIHSHAHADHFIGDKLFLKAKIFWPEIDSKPIEFHDEEFTYSHFFNNSFFPKIDKKLKENETIEFAPFKLQVINSPGHTVGSVCFFDEKLKLLFSGDTLFNGAIGRTDLISGNKIQMLESIQKLKELDFNLLLPGHGELLKGNQKDNLDKAVNLLYNENI